MHLNATWSSSEFSCESLTVSLAVYRLLLNASRLPCLTCRGLHALPARLSLHATSSQACHLLDVRTMFWTLRRCIPPVAEHLHPHLFAARSHWVAPALFAIFCNLRHLSACCWLCAFVMFLHTPPVPHSCFWYKCVTGAVHPCTRDNAAFLLQHMRGVTDGSCVGHFR